jgi:hypothetical protein
VHWSKNELALCIQVLAFSHQLSTIALAVGLEIEDPVTLQFLSLDKLVELKRDYDANNYESAGNQEKLAVMIPVIRELDDEREGAERGEFKEEIVMTKRMLKKTARRAENIDVYMKEIGNELTKQDMYRQIHGWVGPLLPPYSAIEKRGEMRNNVVDYSEYNYKFMAYPILHNLTQTVADKIENLIAYSEIMTRGKYLPPYPVSAARSSTTPRSSGGLSATTPRTSAATRTTSTTSRATWALSSPWRSNSTCGCSRCRRFISVARWFGKPTTKAGKSSVSIWGIWPSS